MNICCSLGEIGSFARSLLNHDSSADPIKILNSLRFPMINLDSPGFRCVIVLFVAMFLISFPRILLSQEQEYRKDQYILRDQGKLTIVVHVWGEVRQPGEYIVPDGTNVLELISRAGGPTDFSNLGSVSLTRAEINPDIMRKSSDDSLSISTATNQYIPSGAKSLVTKLNIKDYLDGNSSYASLPFLHPGDVVRVHRNAWHKWSTVIRVVSQVAIVAQAFYWYSQINN